MAIVTIECSILSKTHGRMWVIGCAFSITSMPFLSWYITTRQNRWIRIWSFWMKKNFTLCSIADFFLPLKKAPNKTPYWIHSHRSYECCTVFLYDYQNVLCISTFNHAIYIGHCTFGYPVLLFFLSRPLWYLLLCVYINTPSLCICMTIRNTYILSMLPMPWTSLGNLLSMGK